METERRSVAEPVEIRAEGNGVKVVGYAAVFNQETDIGGYFHEKVLPGAFAEAIKRDEVVFLINHDGLPLARTKSGTLKLSEDDHGLRIESELDPDDPDAKSVIGKMKRGDLDKMSIAFFMRDGKQSWDQTVDPPLRTIEKVGRLYDVSVVTTPAYDGTDIGLRFLDEHRKAARKAQNFHAAQKRIRMKMNLALKERETGK